MTPMEMQLYSKLQDCHEQKSKWVSLIYLLVMKYGEKDLDEAGGLNGAKLVIPEASKIPLPTLDNPLDWCYDKDSDEVRLTISEDKTERKMIIT